MDFKKKNDDGILEKLVHINRITKVVKGGRRFGFSALVVVGDQAGKIGVAHAKAKQVPDAIKKANETARRKLTHKSNKVLSNNQLIIPNPQGLIPVTKKIQRLDHMELLLSLRGQLALQCKSEHLCQINQL